MLFVGKYYTERAEQIMHDRIHHYGYVLSLYTGEFPSQEDVNASTIDTGSTYHSGGYGGGYQQGTYYKGINNGLQSVSKSNYTRVGAADNNIGTSFTATGPDFGEGKVTQEHAITALVLSTEYTIVGVNSGAGFTSIGAADNNIGTSFTATGPGTGLGSVTQSLSVTELEIGTEYTIWQNGNTDFTLIGAADSSVGTVFTATAAGIGTGLVKQTILITELVAGIVYIIYDDGASDFTLIGAADNNIGTVFTATGAGVGTGSATESLLATELVNGTEYKIVSTDPYSAKLIATINMGVDEVKYTNGVMDSFATMKTLTAGIDGPVTFFELSNKNLRCVSYRAGYSTTSPWWNAGDRSNVMSQFGTVYGIVGQVGTNNNLTVNKQNVVAGEKFYAHDLYLDFTQDLAAVKTANPTLL